ncbi:unnamed protein product [Didymodactylos carnosus]|uniref:Uncharacterized protein n=1 Tax=Didymodactylos carnosus TaxID=1234261 RepID=A0A815QPU1_9BILA|nr:unnamed protein product [Didymodactylos carnosus]CAF4334601.1 unnamed protein product [Didymodactylos carnosus]
MCSISICTRKYQIISKQEPEENASVLFLVRITGKDNHNINTEISARQLRGKSRILVGKQENEIGPLGVFPEHVNANESLLAAGNYTECEIIETLKKAAYDYRKKMHVDEDIFKECRIIARAYLAADVTSTSVKGYVHVVDETPIRVHLFSESQIERYISILLKWGEEEDYKHRLAQRKLMLTIRHFCTN